MSQLSSPPTVEKVEMEAQQPPLAAPPQLADHLHSKGLQITEDGLVTWKKGSPQHPRNWPLGKKVYNASVAIFLDFFM